MFAVVDCALTERARVRGLPKWAWLLIVLLLPVVGPLLWLLVGRGSARTRAVAARDRPGRRPRRSSASPRGAARRRRAPEPDDARWRELEQELANLDSDADDEGDGARR